VLSDLGTLNSAAFITQAAAIANDGTIVGQGPPAADPNQSDGYLWRHGVITDLGAPAGASASAQFISTGVIVGSANTSDGQRIVVWNRF
jgi:uncharacterized membrane protein